jgi:endonuclease/exonuclease/phosphatase family metal-dependent hydrolase
MTRLACLALLLAAAPVGAQAPEPPPDTLTVVTLNIWHDQRDWPQRQARIIAEMGALRPDVVLLQEVLQKPGLENQAVSLARGLGMPHVHFASVDSVGRAQRFGNAILSRHAFTETSQLTLAPLDVYRVAAYARIEVGGRPVRLYTVHLHNPPDVHGAGARAMELVHLLDYMQRTGGDAPLVLGGDFNAEPHWPEMGILRGFRDLGGAGITFGPAWYGFPGRRIDYLFDAADPRLEPVQAGVALDRPDAQGRTPSDHHAVYARFLLR